MSKSRTSAGLLMYRRAGDRVEVLLVHPGGPYYRNKDEGAWSIPKGEIEPGEDPLDAAVREFGEETGLVAGGPFLALAPVRQKGGKVVHAWAFEGDCDPGAIVCNTSRWSGRLGRVGSRSSPRSTGRGSSGRTRRGGRSTPARSR